MAARTMHDITRMTVPDFLASNPNTWNAADIEMKASGCLGSLARWLLDEVVCSKIKGKSSDSRWNPFPDLPTDPGSCWILFARKPQWAMAREAFLLPLQWMAAEDHDECIPADIINVADAAREALKKQDVDERPYSTRYDEYFLTFPSVAKPGVQFRELSLPAVWRRGSGDGVIYRGS